jgi:hypothetical protein
MTHARTNRDDRRGRRAALRVRTTGGSALDAAYARIEATFSPPLWHAMFKERVAALIRGGASHPAARTRYQRLAERYPHADLATAIILVERLRRAELDARATAARIWGRCSRPRLAIMVLDELRLILRVVRRRAPARYPVLLAAVLAAEPGGQAVDIAAEAAE